MGRVPPPRVDQFQWPVAVFVERIEVGAIKRVKPVAVKMGGPTQAEIGQHSHLMEARAQAAPRAFRKRQSGEPMSQPHMVP